MSNVYRHDTKNKERGKRLLDPIDDVVLGPI